MAVQLNHTIVWCRDKQKAASFVTEVLGLGPPVVFGPFLVVELSNGVSLDYYSIEGDIARQHYAFLVSEAEFDSIFERIRACELDYWADPARTELGQINRHDGGRGTYFQDLDGHLLEIITRPYGSGP